MQLSRSVLPWLMFPLLSGADLFLTWWLLGHDDPAAYESNPLAAWCLTHYGWKGLALFKLALVTLVLGAAAGLAWRRPRAGARVMAFGCAVLAGVVVYSTAVAGSAGAFGQRLMLAHAADIRLGEHIGDKLELAKRHQELKDELSQAMRAGRFAFPEAVERLLTSELAHDPSWCRHYRRIYGLDNARDYWAASLLRHALLDLGGDVSLWERFAPGWMAAYEANFRMGSPPPWTEIVPEGFRRSPTASRLALVPGRFN